MSKYQNTIYYDLKSRFLVIFSSNYRHHLVLKIPFPQHIFPQISKYGTENLHFPSPGKYNMNIKFHFIINIDFFQIFCLRVFDRNALYLNASAPLSTQKQMTFFMVRFRLIVGKPCVYFFQPKQTDLLMLHFYFHQQYLSQCYLHSQRNNYFHIQGKNHI